MIISSRSLVFVGLSYAPILQLAGANQDENEDDDGGDHANAEAADDAVGEAVELLWFSGGRPPGLGGGDVSASRASRYHGRGRGGRGGCVSGVV